MACGRVGAPALDTASVWVGANDEQGSLKVSSAGTPTRLGPPGVSRRGLPGRHPARPSPLTPEPRRPQPDNYAYRDTVTTCPLSFTNDC
jgi:hypothetical protein